MLKYSVIDLFDNTQWWGNSLDTTENLGAILMGVLSDGFTRPAGRTLMMFGRCLLLTMELETMSGEGELFEDILKSLFARIHAVRAAGGGHQSFMNCLPM